MTEPMADSATWTPHPDAYTETGVGVIRSTRYLRLEVHRGDTDIELTMDDPDTGQLAAFVAAFDRARNSEPSQSPEHRALAKVWQAIPASVAAEVGTDVRAVAEAAWQSHFG